MKIIDYGQILTNCGYRVAADFDILNTYINKYSNWESFILNRHHVFLKKYIEHNYNLKRLKEDVGYTLTDLSSIFLRIQSQFELIDSSNEEVAFRDMYLDIYNFPVLSASFFNKKNEIDEKVEEEQIKPEEPMSTKETMTIMVEYIKEYIESKENVEKRKFSRKDKLDLLINTFKLYRNDQLMEEISSIMSPNLFKSFELLLNGVELEEVGKKMSLTSQYLLQSLSGTKNPRSFNELGILRLMERHLKK